MIVKPPTTHVAYRCPHCNTTVYGIVGKFALSANMLRLKCHCTESAMDITITNDKKIRLSVPCIFCAQNHNYVVSQSIFFSKDLFLLACPYSNMDIAFIGEKEKTDEALKISEQEISRMLAGLEAESIKDIQPEDMEDDEILPAPEIYDTVRFVVKDLEAEGKIDCPCHRGSYELRYAEDGIEVYCPECNATHLFSTHSYLASLDYITISSLTLKNN